MRKLWLSALLTLCVSASAFALQRQVTDLELSNESDLIVHGTVAAVDFIEGDANYHVMTDLTLHVNRHVKGKQQEEIHVLLPGGQVGEFTVKVSDTPEFQVGDEALFFLYEKADYELHWLYGWEQGALRVQDEQVLARGLSVDDMCTQIQNHIR